MWQLRNSLLAAPNWQRERLAQDCDLDSVLDLLKWPYHTARVSHLARLTWKQPDKAVAGGNSRSTSLLLAARDTCPLGCFFDPPTQVMENQVSQVSEQMAERPTTTEQEQLSTEQDLDHSLTPEPEPPPVVGPRRNPPGPPARRVVMSLTTRY